MSVILEKPPLNEPRKEWADWFLKVWYRIQDASGSGSTMVIAGDGLTGGGSISSDVTLNVGAGTGISVGADTVGLSTSGVVAGSYLNANVTVDTFGRVTSIASGSGSGSSIARTFMLMGA